MDKYIESLTWEIIPDKMVKTQLEERGAIYYIPTNVVTDIVTNDQGDKLVYVNSLYYPFNYNLFTGSALETLKTWEAKNTSPLARVLRGID